MSRARQRLTTEPRWITETQIIRIHDEQLALFGGPPGLRDLGLLASALDRPRNKWAYGEATSLAELAASYGFGLARNHPFADGNKRTAFAAIVVFLGRNGVATDFPQPEAVAVILDLAAGQSSESELAAWIARYV